MENKTTPRSWIEEREKQLRELEEWRSPRNKSVEAELKEVLVEIANCEEELEFIQKLENKPSRLPNVEGMLKQLAKMKSDLQKRKDSLNKQRQDLEAKGIKRDNLKIYVDLAKREYPKSS